MHNGTHYYIGEASKILGISTQTLKKWEEKGYIRSFRTKEGYRIYKKKAIDTFDHDNKKALIDRSRGDSGTINLEESTSNKNEEENTNAEENNSKNYPSNRQWHAYYTMSQAIRACGLSESTLKRYEKKGYIKVLRSMEGHRKFLKSEIDNLLIRADQEWKRKQENMRRDRINAYNSNEFFVLSEYDQKRYNNSNYTSIRDYIRASYPSLF